jgi:hypothetical protein
MGFLYQPYAADTLSILLLKPLKSFFFNLTSKFPLNKKNKNISGSMQKENLSTDTNFDPC